MKAGLAVKKLLIYMVIDVGLALLVAIGFVFGPLLLWPRWTLSPFAQIGMFGGGLVTILLLVASAAYAVNALRPKVFREARLAPYLYLVVPLLVLLLVSLYFLPASALPPPDPTSKPLLIFGPTDEVQALLWTAFTVFVYLPVTLASLFWHGFTIYFLWAYQKRSLPRKGTEEEAPSRQALPER